MTIAGPPNDPPFAEPHLHLRDPVTEFLPERSVPAEADRRIDRASAMDVAAAANASHVRHRVSTEGWVVGAMILGVGLAAGFAGGAAAVMHYGGYENAPIQSVAENHVDAEPPRVEAQPAVDQPPLDPIAQAAYDPPPTIDTPATTTEPESRVNTEQRASVEPVDMIPQSPVAVLYVQSRPAGAQVYLDDRLISTTPFQISGITPGRHSIRIDLRGYRSWSAPVTVEPAARTRIAAALEP